MSWKVLFGGGAGRVGKLLISNRTDSGANAWAHSLIIFYLGASQDALEIKYTEYKNSAGTHDHSFECWRLQLAQQIQLNMLYVAKPEPWLQLWTSTTDTLCKHITVKGFGPNLIPIVYFLSFQDVQNHSVNSIVKVFYFRVPKHHCITGTDVITWRR